MVRSMRIASAAIAGGLCAAAVVGAGHESATSVHASRIADVRGFGETSMVIANLHPSQPATAIVDYYRQGLAASPISIALPPIAPLHPASLYVPGEAVLDYGSYAAVLRGDREVHAVARTEWSLSGGVIASNQSRPGPDVLVPYLAKGFGGQSSVITVQNTDEQDQAAAAITVLDEHGAVMGTIADIVSHQARRPRSMPSVMPNLPGCRPTSSARRA